MNSVIIVFRTFIYLNEYLRIKLVIAAGIRFVNIFGNKNSEDFVNRFHFFFKGIRVQTSLFFKESKQLAKNIWLSAELQEIQSVSLDVNCCKVGMFIKTQSCKATTTLLADKLL